MTDYEIIYSTLGRLIIIYISYMEPEVINVQTFAAKFRSKREVYTFLTVDGDVYLPPYETITVYFLKAILAGAKQCKSTDPDLTFLIDVRQSSLRHVSVPQYDGLSVEKMLLFLDQFEPMHTHLPDQRQEILKLPRQFIINVAATVVGEPFLEFVKKAIADRNT